MSQRLPVIAFCAKQELQGDTSEFLRIWILRAGFLGDAQAGQLLYKTDVFTKSLVVSV